MSNVTFTMCCQCCGSRTCNGAERQAAMEKVIEELRAELAEERFLSAWLLGQQDAQLKDEAP